MTNFVCDLCGFQSEDRAAALAHVAGQHGIADPVEVGQVDQQDGRLYLRSGDSETVIDLDQWLAETLAGLATEPEEPAAGPGQDACRHPADRLFAWLARDDTAPGGVVLCVACCDCGAVLQGGAQLDEVTR